ncbi:pantoate--beta-alanine ligase [Rickettsiella endosymbiont of Dermanyssus gallinae]|uniref:pantoate--beta-alanine ligase n=1 Tax=Rickettsiella endosymbiont of Dermanyssus gallinae TaxID=2856608 RepID=UPI001C52F575|nr:pantoate--beta-alanine ligase [Rickettsiella endosymbiont of Dermanyssus gallinae]
MNIVTSINEWRVLRKKIHGKSIGFVHTMGHLHEGHLSLCARSQQENEITIAAIFINPTQFNRDEDFANYPRTLEKDKSLLAEQKVDYLLLLDKQAIYPDDYHIQVSETTELSQILEGEFRPGHFNGMLTVVLKYLNIVKPSRAYYGEKDYQQLLLIKKMAQALFLETDIVACLTVRAEDGLALSSRNSHLTTDQREKARHFPEMLKKLQHSASAAKQLEALGFKVDYVADQWDRRLAAVWLGDVRLIDNVDYTMPKVLGDV